MKSRILVRAFENLVHLKKQANCSVVMFKGEGMGAEQRRPRRQKDTYCTVDLT